MKKKILAHIAILLILTGGFCNVYIKGLSVSSCGNQLSAYADDDTYTWESVNQSDLVTAFRYYCKSRNLAIEGSIADAVTSFTTSTFNNICNTLGIDPTQLQAELKKTTGGNLGLRFLFTQTGVNAYNRIFAEFLQNNDLSVGDEVEDKVLDNFKYYTDKNGNTCLIYIVDSSYVSGTIPNSHIIQKGSILQSGDYFNSLLNGGSTTFSYDNNTYNIRNNSSYVDYPQIQIGNSNYMSVYGYFNASGNRHYPYYDSGSTIIQIQGSGTLMYAAVQYYTRTTDNVVFVGIRGFNQLNDDNGEEEDGNVNITTNNNTINNNYYNNNYTIIYNDGDVYYNDDDDDDEPSPTTPPPGGGGDDPGTDPDQPPIVDPTPTPEPTVPDWDIELPEMPVGNEWLLYGLEKKFPWDIPFNLMYMLSLFAADPETPHFQGTLDLKVVQWDYDIDLSPFDEIARNVRNFEFVGFIIGLMLLTRKLIWG